VPIKRWISKLKKREEKKDIKRKGVKVEEGEERSYFSKNLVKEAGRKSEKARK
jgi:hypothetical protein